MRPAAPRTPARRDVASRRRPLLALAGLAVVAGSFAAGTQLGRHSAAPAAAPPAAPRAAPLREELLDVLASSYYRPLPRAATRARTAAGVIAALHDPYTEYLPARAYRRLRDSEASRYPGVGLSLTGGRSGLVVEETLPGLPAERAGIRRGDVITSIDGRALASLPYSRAVELMREGGVGSRVRLRVVRPGSATPRVVTLVRREVALPVTRARTISFAGRRYGYVRLAGFPRGSAARVRRLAVAARGRVAGMILDLRGNPGGLLSEAVDVVRVFDPRGMIVATQGLHEPYQRFQANGSAVRGLRVAVLVDRDSASSAEVVAGALQLARRAVVVGERTFGKGTVQAVQPLPSGGALKVTVAHFLLPGGVPVQGRGVRPQLVAPDRVTTPADETLAAALEQLAR